MKILKVLVFVVLALGLIISASFAGDVEKGKALFNDPKLGTTGKSCGSCHVDGAKLDKAVGKDEKALAETVNKCIAANLKGKALDVNSDDMKNIVAYVQSVAGKAPKKKVIQGC